MILNRKAAFSSAIIGFLVGFIWEGLGSMYLWVLATPQFLIFGLAMIAWPILGLIFAAILRIIDVKAPGYKAFLKPLTGPIALIVARMTNKIGLISYPPEAISIFGVPLYMMTGMLVLVYLLDFIVIRRMSLQRRQ